MKKKTPPLTIEAAMERLEEIVTELEEGTLSIDESLKRYEEGIELTKFCNEKLNKTEEKIKMLRRSGDDFEVVPTDI